jgi:alpha-beta hydrolase superfamily lysophospholipase
LCQYLEKSNYSLKAKVLLLQAQKEKVVDNSAQDRVVKKFKNSDKVLIENGFHELLNESEPILSEVLSEIFSFLEK